MKTVLCVSAAKLCAHGAALMLERLSNGTIHAIGVTPAQLLSTNQTVDHLLLDLSASRGSQVVRAMRAACPGVQAIALVDASLEEEVLAYARAGVTSYFTHDSEPSQIVAALLDGGPYVAQPVATILLRKVAHSDESELSGERLLTPRELHVLNLIEKGLSNKEIARALCVEIATVKNHVHQILSKTRARRRSQAIHMLRR